MVQNKKNIKIATILIGLLMVLIVVTPTVVLADRYDTWLDPNWQYRMPLFFNNTGLETHENMPIMVKLTTSNFDYSKCNANGSDIRFVSIDGITSYSYHFDVWNSSGNSWIWVNVTSIAENSATDYMYIYYGNVNAIDAQNSSSIYDSNFVGVWHMDDGIQVTDYTQNQHHGTPIGFEGDEEQLNGQIGSCLVFDGIDDYVNVTTDDDFNVTEFTMSCWMRKSLPPTGGWRVFLGRGNESTGSWGHYSLATYRNRGQSYGVRLNETDTYEYLYGGGTWQYTNDTWVYMVLRYSEGQQTLIVSNTSTDTLFYKWDNATYGGTKQSNVPFRIGIVDTNDEFFVACVDEVQLSNVARSDDWIEVQYKIMMDDYLTFGDVERFSESSSYLPWIIIQLMTFVILSWFILLIIKLIRSELGRGGKREKK